MGQLIKSKADKEILEKLSKTRDLRSALEFMAELQGNTFMEEEKVAEYDIKTGKPSKFVREPYKKFGPDFTFGGEFYGGDIKVQLTNEVIKEIKKGPVCFDKNNKRYIAKFETKNHSDSEYGKCIEHLIYLSEVRTL